MPEFTIPAQGHAAIVNDATIAACRAIYVGVGGDISVICNGVTVVYKNAVAGTIIPVFATKVTAANTTATNLVALF